MKKTALITGASKGIGKALAPIIAKDNINLVLVARDKAALEKLATELSHIECHILPVDLSQNDAVSRIMEYLNQHQIQITHLINNAGFGYHGEFGQCKEEDVAGMVRVNIAALSELTREIIPSMKQNKYGYVMNVASIAAFLPGPFMAQYYATKAYVKSFSEALAEELRHYNIKVSALCPGVTDTEFFDRAGMNNTNMGKRSSTMMPAETVAIIGWEGLLKGRRIVIPGLLNRILAYASLIAPTPLVIKAVQYLHK